MRYFKSMTAAAALVGLCAPALADDLLPTSVRYACERGAEVKAIYVNPPEGRSLAILYVEGQLIALAGMEAASGALYGPGEGEPGYRWHTHNEEAMLSHLAQDAGEARALLSACVMMPAD